MKEAEFFGAFTDYFLFHYALNGVAISKRNIYLKLRLD